MKKFISVILSLSLFFALVPISQAQYNPRTIGVGLGISTFSTLADSPTITLVVDTTKTEQHNKVTLGGNRALLISGATNGMTGILLVNQDATGNRTITLPAGSKVLPGGNATITLTSAPNSIDSLDWMYDGTNFIWTQNVVASSGTGTVTSVDISGGSTGLTSTGGPVTTTGTFSLGGILNKLNGGTGTSSASLIGGSNINIAGLWPSQTISFTGVLPVANGGTGSGTAAFTAGTGITITGTFPNYTITATGGAGAGDVVGPASSANNQGVQYASSTGKLLKASTLTGLIKQTVGIETVAVPGTDYGRVDSITLTNPSGLFSTPLNFTVGAAGATTATLALQTQTAGTFFAGPTVGLGAATPTFRVIAAADLPATVNYNSVQTVGNNGTATIANTTDTVRFTTALTAPLILTLPAATAKSKIRFVDPIGVASTTNTISIARVSSDTIDGGTANVVIANGTYLTSLIASDSTSKWAVQTIPISSIQNSATSTLSLTDPNANSILGWDDTLNIIKFYGSSDLNITGSNINLATTGITAGAYTNTNLTVDNKGRITVIANGTAGGGSGYTPGSASVYVRGVAVQTTGNVPVDLVTITVPTAAIPRYRFSGTTGTTASSTILVETQAGAIGGTFELQTLANGGGTAVLTSTAPANGVGATTGWPATGPSAYSVSTLHVRQLTNATNTGTLSFYVTLVPLPNTGP